MAIYDLLHSKIGIYIHLLCMNHITLLSVDILFYFIWSNYHILCFDCI